MIYIEDMSHKRVCEFLREHVNTEKHIENTEKYITFTVLIEKGSDKN